MSISQLISNIQSLSIKNSTLSRDALIDALKELDSMIEIDVAKELLITELKKILYCLIEENKSLQPQMFHTVIYGPSGCGKTTLAKILSKIWRAVGILSSDEKKIIVIKEDKLRDIFNRFNALHSSHLQKNRTHATEELWKSIRDDLSSFLESKDKSSEVINSNISVLTGRETFVADYSGQTSSKTLEFLKNNKGKCIIVEEAYSLYSGHGDNYGMEVLTLLNRWMEEEADSNIFIFVGYKEMMLDTIFSVQRGLKRRFLWVFDIKGYTSESLAHIFTQQCDKNELILSPQIDLLSFFQKNYDKFKHYGGDTLRLSNFCKSIFYSNAFEDLCKGNQNTVKEITEEIFMQAYQNYLINIIE
jgi:energy-coupling factor transporter ATP-binding protein EcfA2